MEIEQGLDAGGSGLAQGATAAGELAESGSGGFLLETFGQPLLGGTRVENLLSVNTGDHQHLAGTALELAFGSVWKRKHIEQGSRSGSVLSLSG